MPTTRHGRQTAAASSSPTAASDPHEPVSKSGQVSRAENSKSSRTRAGSQSPSGKLERQPSTKPASRRRRPTADELVQAAREAHRQRPGPMNLVAFEKLTGYTSSQVTRAFAGGWTELRRLAGIPLHQRETRRYSDDELLAEFHRIARLVRRIPKWEDISRRGRVSQAPFHNRFGRKAELLRRYRDWLQACAPDSPLAEKVDRACRSAEAAWPDRRAAPRTVYGEDLPLAALAHAPTNEKGVIYLFGLLAERLGYRVESMGASFPDCEAKRALDAARTQWQRVRIEFEHCSRKFRAHRHDPAGCDLIVCWEHDWAECPLEVLELSEAVRRLKVER